MIDVTYHNGRYVMRFEHWPFPGEPPPAVELPDAFDAWSRLTALVRGRGIDMALNSCSAGRFPFLAICAIDDGIHCDIYWCDDLATATEQARSSCTTQGGALARILSLTEGRTVIIDHSTPDPFWATVLGDLEEALERQPLSSALRQVSARHPAMGRVEWFECLRYGAKIDHRTASVLLHWEPDEAKAQDRYADEDLDRDVEPRVRAALSLGG